MNREYSGTKTDFYVADPNVADVVNLAIALRRPLLVEGEPGCGKTKLAYSVARELDLGEPIKFTVKSTSQAQDLLYRVNSLRRLQDAQRQDNKDAAFIYPYLSLGLLGEALNQKRRSLVLIDEIDKADVDFPNDLLDVLDTFEFTIHDLPAEEESQCLTKHGFGRVVRATSEAMPVVVITSNREKQLPEPFLRRCLYVVLPFPEDAAALAEIVRKNTAGGLSRLDEDVLHAAIASFKKIRGLAQRGNAQKVPTTSELIDWVKVLHWNEKTRTDIEAGEAFPPYWRTLFKTMQDLTNHEAYGKAQANSQSPGAP